MAKKREIIKKPLNLGVDDKIEFVRLHFVDITAKSYFLSYRIDQIDYEQLEKAIVMPNISVPGFEFYNRQIFLKPDLSSSFLDPFSKQKTLVINSSLVTKVQDSAVDYSPISFDIRGIVKKAEEYLLKTGIGTSIEFNIVMEFFLFDGVASCDVQSHCLANESRQACDHRAAYPKFIDDSLDVRNKILTTLEGIGINACMHFLEGKDKVVLGLSSTGTALTADKIQTAKYVIKNVANLYGKTATFMPSSMPSQGSAGLYIGHSIYLDNRTIFRCPEHHHLSDITTCYINGILMNTHNIFAFTNPTTNSYGRLNTEESEYVEFRYASEGSIMSNQPNKITPDDLSLCPGFPDASANPYLSIASILLAGIYGVTNKVKLEDLNVKYDKVSKLASGRTPALSLLHALALLGKGRGFLKANGVFDDVFIDHYIKVKREEWKQVESSISPAEINLYY